MQTRKDNYVFINDNPLSPVSYVAAKKSDEKAVQAAMNEIKNLATVQHKAPRLITLPPTPEELKTDKEVVIMKDRPKRPVKFVFFEYQAKTHTAFVAADEDDAESVKKAKAQVAAYQRLFHSDVQMMQVAPMPNQDVLSAPPGALEKAEMKPIQGCCCVLM